MEGLELKPCPFCASENNDVMWVDWATRGACLDCGAYGPRIEGENAEAPASQAWNTRARPTVAEAAAVLLEWSVNRRWGMRTAQDSFERVLRRALAEEPGQ